jgi:hypothetical protein
LIVAEWKLVKAAKLQSSTAAVSRFGEYVTHRPNELGLEQDRVLHSPETLDAPIRDRDRDHDRELDRGLDRELDRQHGLEPEPGLNVLEPDGQTPDREPEPFVVWAAERVDSREHLYTLVMNPGEGRLSREMVTAWAHQTLERAQVQHGYDLEYRFWVHDDHTPHSHVHALIASPVLLSERSLNGLKFEAGKAWREVELEYPRSPEPQPVLELVREPVPEPVLDRSPEPQLERALRPTLEPVPVPHLGLEPDLEGDFQPDRQTEFHPNHEPHLEPQAGSERRVLEPLPRAPEPELELDADDLMF